MENNYLDLPTAPGLEHPGYPTCTACSVEVEHDGDDWVCPGCGTCWPGHLMEDDGSSGTLYKDWSGEEPGGVTLTLDEVDGYAWALAGRDVGLQQKRLEWQRLAMGRKNEL